jgi:hypothetical protein
VSSRRSDGAKRDRRRRLLELLSEVPDQYRTHEEWVRYHHLDLPGLPLTRLLFERDRLKQLLLLFDDAADPWHVSRFRALEAQLAGCSCTHIGRSAAPADDGEPDGDAEPALPTPGAGPDQRPSRGA